MSKIYKNNNIVVFENNIHEFVYDANSYDVFGELMSKEDAELEYSRINNKPVDRLEQFEYNIKLADKIIAIIRCELTDSDDYAKYLNELLPVIQMTQLGMFLDAAEILRTMQSTVITTEQIDRWSNLLISGNGIL